MVHLFGLVLLLGGIGLVDLRLLGAFPKLPLDALSEALTPLAITGVLLLISSGSVLFAADAVALAGSRTFQWKLVLIGLGLLNALSFRFLVRGGGWSLVPRGAQMLALVSLLLWASVLILGRMIAYS